MEKHPAQEGDNESERHQAAGRQSEQRFVFGGRVFDIDQAQAIIAERPRQPGMLPVAPWAQAYGFDTLDDPHTVPIIGPGPDFNRDYAMTTDLNEPAIVATMYSQEHGQDYPLLIDGTHRLYRAYQEGITELPAYVLTVDETLAIREDLPR